METVTLPPTAPATSPVREARTRVHHLAETATFRAFRHAFETATGLPLVFRAPGSFAPPTHGTRHANPFCVALAAHSHACAACLRVQGSLETLAAKTTATLECHAGLQESAVPVRVGDQLIGFLQTGQVAWAKVGPRRLRAITAENPEIAADQVPLGEAYRRTRVMPKEQYEAALRILTIFAHHLATLSYQTMVQETLAENPGITKAKAFVAEHLTEEIHLNDAAHATNMSSFYFCKLFRKAMGITFTAYVARQRIAVVKQKLLDPNVRIGEAAFATGFQSLSQFNRVFQRLTGESPSGYRQRLHITHPSETHSG